MVAAGGVQLDDTSNPDGSTVPGVLTLISDSTCAELDGQRRCVSSDEIRREVIVPMKRARQTTPGTGRCSTDAGCIAAGAPRRRLATLAGVVLFDEWKLRYLRRDDEAYIPQPANVRALVCAVLYGNEDEAASYERGRDAINVMSAQSRVERTTFGGRFQAFFSPLLLLPCGAFY